MKVMKFPDGGDAAECHLEKRHARRIVNIFRRETRGGAIHHLAPRPKTIFVTGGARLGAPANHALKCVGVSVDKAGKYGAVFRKVWFQDYVSLRLGRGHAPLWLIMSLLRKDLMLIISWLGRGHAPALVDKKSFKLRVKSVFDSLKVRKAGLHPLLI